MQTATVTMRDAKGRTVDLVAAVHVADEKYYAGLEKSFKGYEALLYEMVKPAGQPPPAKGTKTGGAVTTLQRFLKDVLDLQYQLDAIDYSAPNFVHADLSAEQFFQMQEDRGESLAGILLQSMLREMSKADVAGNDDPLQLGEFLMALQSPDRSRQLKLILAKQFDNVEEALAGLNGPDGSVILTERNEKAFRTINEELKEGKTHLGLFFGAAHLPDIQERLEAEGFKKVGTTWHVAWDMRAATTRPSGGDGE